MRDIRFITIQNVTYLRKEDVIEYILDLAAGEETDVRNRLGEAAQNIQGISKENAAKQTGA